MKSKPRAIQLIAIDEHSKQLFLTQQGKQFLNNINQPVAVVTIAGLYRTGKSYLVNQFVKSTLNNQEGHGFKVGSTIQSVTKGLNVWSVPIQAKDNQNGNQTNFYYLVIDSQGIGSMEQQVTYDLNLLMLIFLISSTVIYNSQGAIDQQSLDQLRVVVNMQKCLNANTNQPKFIWVLRDFALQLMNKNGKQMTQNQYLQNCLQQTVTKNRQLIKKNQIRTAIKQSLKNRSCYTLVRPTLNQSDLGNLQQNQSNKLRAQFIEGIKKLRQDVFTNEAADIKCVNQNQVTGIILGQLIQSYLNQINCCKIPEIKSIWEMIVLNQVQQLIQQCLDHLKAKTEAIVLPLSDEQLKIKLNQIQNKIFGQFQNKIPSQNGKTYKKFHSKFMKQVQRINQRIKKNNNQIIKGKRIKQLKSFISSNIKYENIQPCKLNDFKIILERALLKVCGEPEGLFILMETVYDVFEICHNKSEQMLHDNGQLKNLLQNQNNLRKGSESQLIALKREYHQILKHVSNHQNSKIQLDNAKESLEQQNLLLKKRVSQLENQLRQKQSVNSNRISQLLNKQKTKNQEYNSSIKKLRQQNYEMTHQIQQLKNHLLMAQSKQKKQLIFQEKIEGTWKIFQQERTFFKSQLQKYKQKYFSSQQAQKQLQIKYQNNLQNQRVEKEKNAQKERQFVKQLQWMKQNYQQNKKVYLNTCNTIKQNDKILKDIQTNSILNQRNSLQKKIIQSEKQQKQILNSQNEAKEKSQNIQLRLQMKQLKLRIEELQYELNAQFSKKQEFQKIILKTKEQKQSIIQKYKNLSEDFDKQKERFGNSLSLIQQAKNQERSIYEESIIKLLGNIQKFGVNPRQNQTNSFYSSVSSHYKR